MGARCVCRCDRTARALTRARSGTRRPQARGTQNGTPRDLIQAATSLCHWDRNATPTPVDPDHRYRTPRTSENEIGTNSFPLTRACILGIGLFDCAWISATNASGSATRRAVSRGSDLRHLWSSIQSGSSKDGLLRRTCLNSRSCLDRKGFVSGRSSPRVMLWNSLKPSR